MSSFGVSAQHVVILPPPTLLSLPVGFEKVQMAVGTLLALPEKNEGWLNLLGARFEIFSIGVCDFRA